MLYNGKLYKWPFFRTLGLQLTFSIFDFLPSYLLQKYDTEIG